jgi:fumarylacetoacetase
MALKSWIASANDPETDFPLANLPYGVFRHAGGTHIGVAIGDQILNLRVCATENLLASLNAISIEACAASVLNPLMTLGPAAWSALRRRISELLSADHASADTQHRVTLAFAPMREVEMQLPAHIGDYTDFYASIHHATRIGRLFRPDNPLLPNYKYVPIGYHGRASSIIVSGSNVRRPSGQTKPPQVIDPIFGPSHALDYELEVGIFLGAGNSLGTPIPIEEAERHIFGLCLVNDWSARDIQSWEYQPLGPFLAKNFATSISPWIVPMEALAPYRVLATARPDSDPAPLKYLALPSELPGSVDLTLEVYLQTKLMRDAGQPPARVSRGNMRDLYWSIAQLVTHHASNGCNLRPGDLLATGTISGAAAGSEGCLLEMKHRAEPLRLPNGETRIFLEDGDRVTLRAFTQRAGLPRIGFGECTGTVIAAL